MEKNFRINPVGLKGKEINQRMKQLMGVTPINEGLSRSTVELTKIGPDGKAYGIVRENHEYYIKVSDKTENLTVEDFKYIGGLQNKKSEAYPSYAKATKHLNLKFNSICESFDIVNTFNVFVDDNLLSEGGAAKEATKHITDAKGKELGGKIKEEGGDNLADKKVIDELEEVTLTEDELAIDAMLNENDEDFIKKEKNNENWGKPNKINKAKNFDEWVETIDSADAKEILKSIYFEIGKPVVDIAKTVLKKTTEFVGGPEVKDAIAKRDNIKNKDGFEEGKSSNLNNDDELKNENINLDEEITLEEIKEAIAELKKKL